MSCGPGMDGLLQSASIGDVVSLDNQWPGLDTLRHRYINMRAFAVAYEGSAIDGRVCILCAVMNNYSGASDGVGTGVVESEIVAGNGGLLRFRVCDDMSEWYVNNSGRIEPISIPSVEVLS
jgi:hypothetical protein